ncbi:MAG: hypothetical protein LPK58_06275 [Gammaproteobacteria bacterium]|nr:hypothetical protein [Gammaproteobacteria bacterium]
MPQLIVEPTSTAQWQRLVREAGREARRELDEELESYLVMLLARGLREVDGLSRVVALDYLHSLAAGGQDGVARLRDVGDRCLLTAGLFPHRAERRLVRIAYFVDLGRSAYDELAARLGRAAAELFRHVAAAFVPLMEVLQAMRMLDGHPALNALEAAELIQDTGSEAARRELARYTDGMLAPEISRHRH